MKNGLSRLTQKMLLLKTAHRVWRRGRGGPHPMGSFKRGSTADQRSLKQLVVGRRLALYLLGNASMIDYSYVQNSDPAVVEQLYQQYQQDPASVEIGWRKFFEGYDLGVRSVPFSREDHLAKERYVLNLINGYRTRGHLFTRTNPVRERRKYSPTLDIENFELSTSDLDTVFQAGTEIGIGPAPLRDIIAHLETTYCQSIGAQFRYLGEPETIQWLQTRMEKSRNIPQFSIEEKKRILHKLNQAVVFENFLHTRFVGQKRFSLEGAESLISALDAIVTRGAELGVEEFVIGMAHRGRLNVLANILGKTYEDLFTEFEAVDPGETMFSGDVKYHLGYSSDRVISSDKKVHLSLVPNPSHLEAVDPVVEGVVRAKIDRLYGGDSHRIAPILIHGDAAIAGQGIVYEVIQMSQLEGYRTGGTIHVVVNNQVGFTTNYLDGRSSIYCTDVSKVTLSPVFHVNGDDVEALVHAIRMAVEFRQQFRRDVFIDLLGYRKHGHNEADEPRFTQPRLYKAIAAHPDPREIYVQKLISQGSMEAEMAEQMEQRFRKNLQQRLDEAKQRKKAQLSPFLQRTWSGLRLATPEDFEASLPTGISKDSLLSLGDKMLTLPTELNIFDKMRKLFDDRRKLLLERQQLDWALGEWMAYATLLTEGVGVRLSGQDCKRGTFAHRHATIVLEDSEEHYVPLNHLSEKQARFQIFNSLLSEYGVLGFEFGYAMANPHDLVVWEAQFGDFANGAQIIIDQFLSCSETKWQRMNGLVLYLPHGYEGQGPEHSSARMERFLELCADYNMQVVNCTTPANFFHVLRRQMIRPFRKPLVVFTPKSLLRHPACISPIAEIGDGTRFQELIDDVIDPKGVRRALLCSGKIYYDLIDFRQKSQRSDVAILRMEQIFPLPLTQLNRTLARYPHIQDIVWVQEEPENMGAWPFLLRKLGADYQLTTLARRETAAPAGGFYRRHVEELRLLLEGAFSLEQKANRSPARKAS